MAGKFLLDTNIVLAIWQGDLQVLKKLSAENYHYLPSVVLGELYFGACHSSKVESNLERVDLIAALWAILPCDATTARQYGLSRELLSQKGKPIPENDIWIAALAIQHSLILVTSDEHFQHVEKLSLEAW